MQKEHSLVLVNGAEFSALEATGAVPLPDRHREHFSRVLRRATEWPALVGNGSGTLMPAIVKGGLISAVEGSPRVEPAPRRRQVKLTQAWVKPKALALILQKAAELGTDEICLVDSEFSQPHSEKAARLDAILENACMQAYNPVKPRLVIAQNLAEIPCVKDSCFFGDLEAKMSLRNVNLQQGTSTFINGPEGGFSPAEIGLLRERATGVLLSENVLRSDSAAITALGFLRLPE